MEEKGVKPAPPPEKTGEDPRAVADKLKLQAAQKSAKKPKPPRQGGVGMAIAATVIIVIALAAMATYAYIKTQK